MGTERPGSGNKKREPKPKSVSLKELANYVGLAPATVSLVMNGSLTSGIAPETRDRVLAAARKLNYRPNFLARSLRTRKSFTVGVLMPDVSEGYSVTVLRGIEAGLRKAGYFHFVASHHLRAELIEEYVQMFQDRSVDGLIIACAPWTITAPYPVVSISSENNVKGTASVLLDHDLATELALRHLIELGHKKVAFIKGIETIPDTEIRWSAIVRAAGKLGLQINPKLVVQIEDPATPSGPHLGYGVTQKLLARGEPFTALFTFNDVSAFGAIRALSEAGLRVPDDVSVMGFDDIESAAYQTRALTTIRQPLEEMGRLAAENLLRRIAGNGEMPSNTVEQVFVAPELVVRETTSGAQRSGKAV